MTKIRNWHIVVSDNSYLCPELRCAVVCGETDHPDGPHIRTSQVASFNGRAFTTHSGTRYELEGDPVQAFLDALDGLALDCDHPFAALHTDNRFRCCLQEVA